MTISPSPVQSYKRISPDRLLIDRQTLLPNALKRSAKSKHNTEAVHLQTTLSTARLRLVCTTVTLRVER